MSKDETGFVAGANRENARRLIEVSDALGLPRASVKLVNGGFRVPVAILDAIEAAEKPKQTAPKAEAKPAPKKAAAKADETKEGDD